MARSKHDRSFARDCDIEIVGNGVIAGAVCVGINRDHLPVNADLRTRSLVPLVGLFLPVRIDSLVH